MFVKEIDAMDLKARLDAGDEIALIDIRSDAEVARESSPMPLTLRCT
jgi:rhodanese-related sulfurtransferase